MRAEQLAREWESADACGWMAGGATTRMHLCGHAYHRFDQPLMSLELEPSRKATINMVCRASDSVAGIIIRRRSPLRASTFHGTSGGAPWQERKYVLALMPHLGIVDRRRKVRMADYWRCRLALHAGGHHLSRRRATRATRVRAQLALRRGVRIRSARAGRMSFCLSGWVIGASGRPARARRGGDPD
jgi:hypothetical protein